MNQSGFADLKNQSIIDADSLIVGLLVLPNLDPNSIPYIDSSNTLSDIVLNDGQLVIGNTGDAPQAANITGTADEIIVTNGPGTITLSTPQQIGPTSSPTFDNLTVTTINGKIGNDLVTGPVSAVIDRLASYTGVTGKVIKDSGINTADVFLRTGTVPATGNFNLNSNELQNVAAIRPANTNIIIGTSASATNASNIVIGNSSSVSLSSSCIVIGNSDTLQHNCINGVAIGNSITLTPFGGMGDGVYVGSNITSQGGARNVIIGKGSTNDTGTDNVIIGEGSSITGGGINNVVIGSSSTMSGNGGVSVGENNTVGGSSVTVGQGNTCTAVRAHSLGLNVSNATANSFLIDARTNVRCDVDNMTDLGTTTRYWKDGYFKGSLIGGTNSRTVDNIVSNSGTGTLNNLCSFTSAKIIKDSGISASSIVTGGPYLPLAGGTMGGNITMGSNNVTGTGANIAGSYSASLTTASTSITTGAIVSAGGCGIAGKTFIGSNIVIGPTQSITLEQRLTLRGTTSSFSAGPNIAAYAHLDIYPLYQQLNWAHDNIGLQFDCYYDVGGWTSSEIGSNFQIYKHMNKLQFNYASGTAAGSAITLLNAGFIDTSGILQWARSIKTSDVTVSSSTITGAIVSAGGIGIAGTAYIGGAGFVKSSQPICSGKYVQRSLGALVEISNLEVSWFTGLTSSGSLVYAAGSIVGLTLRFTGYMYLTVAGGGNYTLRLKNSSGTFITHTIAPVCTNKYTKIETLTTFASGTTCYTTSTILIDGLTPFIFYSSGTWNSAISQTLNVTQQFSISSAANFHKTHSCIFESIYEP